jgi:TonB family protein
MARSFSMRESSMRIFKLKGIAISIFLGTIALFASTDFPKPVSSAMPVYPELARNARVAGSVKLWFVLNADGRVTQTGIISGNPLLIDATVNAVKSWRFQPSILKPNARFKTEFVYYLGFQQKEGEPNLTVSIKDFRRVDITSERYEKPIE